LGFNLRETSIYFRKRAVGGLCSVQQSDKISEMNRELDRNPDVELEFIEFLIV